MIAILTIGLLNGCIAAWLLTLARKWGVIEKLQVNARNEFMEKLFSCYFCMSWWTSVLLCIIASIAACNGWLLFGVFVSTMVSVKMIP